MLACGASFPGGCGADLTCLAEQTLEAGPAQSAATALGGIFYLSGRSGSDAPEVIGKASPRDIALFCQLNLDWRGRGIPPGR